MSGYLRYRRSESSSKIITLILYLLDFLRAHSIGHIVKGEARVIGILLFTWMIELRKGCFQFFVSDENTLNREHHTSILQLS